MDDRSEMTAQIAQLIEELEALRTEVAILRQWTGRATACHPISCPSVLQGDAQKISEYRQTIEVLRQSEANLQAAQRLAHMGSWHWECTTNTITWSEEMYRIHGRDPSLPAPQGDEIAEYIHPDDLALYQQLTQQALVGFSFKVDLRIIRPDGAVRFIEARGEPGVFSQRGELLCLFGTVLDVTDRKRIEQALRQSEFALRQAQRLAHVGSWHWSVETGVEWSEEIFRIHGLDPNCPPPNQDLLARYIHPDDAEIHTAIVAASRTGQPYEFDLRIVRPDGEIRYIEARGEPGIRNERGQIIELFGTVLDVTDRKRIEEKLRCSEAAIRAMLSAIPDMLIRAKADGTRLFISPGELKSCQPIEKLAGQSIHQTLPPELAKQRMEFVKQAIETGQRQIYEYEIVIDGETRQEEARIVAINAEEALIVIRDRTEQHQLEQSKTEFISVVSHELRTPLTSIQMALSLLDEQLVEPASEDGQAMIHVATEGVDRLVRLVNDILDLERLESGKLQINTRSCNPVTLVQTAIAQMQELANRSNITVQVSVEPCSIEADPDCLVQVLTNLLSNAIRFSPTHSTIEIHTTAVIQDSSQAALLQFSVKDQGRGIPADQLDRIFERFQQVDTSDSREKGGTGLGLAICRSIIQQHGGQIWAASKLGEGSTFYFTIPILERNVDVHKTDSTH